MNSILLWDCACVVEIAKQCIYCKYHTLPICRAWHILVKILSATNYRAPTRPVFPVFLIFENVLSFPVFWLICSVLLSCFLADMFVENLISYTFANILKICSFFDNLGLFKIEKLFGPLAPTIVGTAGDTALNLLFVKTRLLPFVLKNCFLLIIFFCILEHFVLYCPLLGGKFVLFFCIY